MGNCSERETCPAAPFGNRIAHNLVVNATTPIELANPNKTGFDNARFDVQGNFVTSRPPGFVSDPAETLCFALAGSSPVVVQGFQQPPFGQMGTGAWRARYPCRV